MPKCMESKSVIKLLDSNLQSEDPLVIQEHYQNLREEMTRILPDGHPVQLTLLWEHVVRTQQFPLNVNPHLVFHEILERLKSPEWQVRQHALRVFTDIFPTLCINVTDENMQLLVTELISNLGHSTPAVRKGSLDALRIYLLYSRDKEFPIKDVVFTELNRTEEFNDFRSNVKIGIILSIPLLLFPSKKSEGPSRAILQEIILTLTGILTDPIYEKVTIRSLTKIRDIVGIEEFNSYFTSVSEDVKNQVNILCETYNLTTTKSPINKEENKTNCSKSDSTCTVSSDKICGEQRGETCGNTNKSGESNEVTLIPASRVVLETEIKFDKETAITMTILEEKNANNDLNKSSENIIKGNIVNEDVQEDKSLAEEKRKMSRRVHFGGEEVKLRTPESEHSEAFTKEVQRSKIPLPLSPATRIPRYRRSLINLDNSEKPSVMKRSVSATNINKKHEPHIHNANLSPKKSILTNSNSLTDIQSATKLQQNIIQSPKKEFIKYDEDKYESLYQLPEFDDNIVSEDTSDESFRIFMESEIDNNSADHINFQRSPIDQNETENALILRMNRESPSSILFIDNPKMYDIDAERDNNFSLKNRPGSLERKIDKNQSKLTNYEKTEPRVKQSSGSKKRISRRRSADKLPHSIYLERGNSCVIQEIDPPEINYLYDNDISLSRFDLNDENFESSEENDIIINNQNSSQNKSEKINNAYCSNKNQQEDAPFKSYYSEFTLDNYENRNKRKIKNVFTSVPNYSELHYKFV